MTIVSEDKVVDVLKQCMDPEIPIDLWNLGLIYNIDIQETGSGKSAVSISMSLTQPGCSMGRHMSADIKTRLEKLDDVEEAHVQIVWDPQWNTNMMSPEARKKMNVAEHEIICRHGE